VKAHDATRLIPIVLMSGSHERDRRIAGLAAGADDFLAKPVDSEELAARVRSRVRVKRLTDELESAEALFLTLGHIVEARDSSTHGHCERLAACATALGTSCGLDRADLIALRRGAFLHDIPLVAQIVTIVDVYDALTTNRPYRKAMSRTAAFATMRAEALAGAYSTGLVDRFVRLMRSDAPSRVAPHRARSSPIALRRWRCRGSERHLKTSF
jgi:response regulator RpfG family c-di-GMP phosphodiesterase